MKETLDHQRSKKLPVRKSVWIAGDNELSEELEEVEAAFNRRKALNAAKAEAKRTVGEADLQEESDLEKRVADLKAKVRADGIKFTFQAIRRKDSDKLVMAHQPTEDQVAAAKAEGEDNIQFNPDTYPMALILRTMVEPEFDHNDSNQEKDMEDWLESAAFNNAEFQLLFINAVQAQQTRRVLDLGKESGETHTFG